MVKLIEVKKVEINNVIRIFPVFEKDFVKYNGNKYIFSSLSKFEVELANRLMLALRSTAINNFHMGRNAFHEPEVKYTERFAVKDLRKMDSDLNLIGF